MTGHLSKCLWDLRVFLDDARGCQCPFVLCLHPQVFLQRSVLASGSFQEWTVTRVAAAFSTSDGDLSLPLGLALGSPIFPSGCEGKLGVALESLQGRRDLT